MYEDLKKYLWKFYPYKEKAAIIDSLIFYLNRKTDYEALKEYSLCKLPELNSLELRNVTNDDMALFKFLIHSTPKKLNEFAFKYNLMDLNTTFWYADQLSKIAQHTYAKFHIYGMNLKQEEFWKLVKSARNWEKVEFISWNIWIHSKLKFDNDFESRISFLSLQNSIKSHSMYCWDKMKWFEHLVQGISEWDQLSKSLQELDVTKWSLFTKRSNEILMKLKLEHIILII